MATAELPHGDSAGTFLGHPKGLFVLFFAEMWERFSYYGMRALLIFYLTKHWLFSDAKSNLIYGAYTSLVYITPVLGGYLADRYSTLTVVIPLLIVMGFSSGSLALPDMPT